MWEGIGLDTEGEKTVTSARKYSENGFQGFLGEIFFEKNLANFPLGEFFLGRPMGNAHTLFPCRGSRPNML